MIGNICTLTNEEIEEKINNIRALLAMEGLGVKDYRIRSKYSTKFFERRNNRRGSLKNNNGSMIKGIFNIFDKIHI